MNEAAVKKRVKTILKAVGIWYYMPIPHGYRGIGDFQCCANGRFLMIETKGDGGRQTPAQKVVEALVRSNGGAYWLIGPDELPTLKKRLESFKHGPKEIER